MVHALSNLPAMKKGFVLLKEVDSITIQSSVRNILDACTCFKKTKALGEVSWVIVSSHAGIQSKMVRQNKSLL